jgi:hypothetical protein
MKIIRKVRGALVTEEVDLRNTTMFAKAIQTPGLVQSTISIVTTAAEYSKLLDSFKKLTRPFAICVVTTNLEIK